MFRSNLLDVEVFQDEHIRAARRALRPSGREASLRADKRAQLPACIEMLDFLRGSMWDTERPFDQMIYLSTITMYQFLLRVSSVAYDSNVGGKHALLVEDVLFTLNNGNKIHAPLLQFWKNDDVNSIIFFFRSNKVWSPRSRIEVIQRRSAAEARYIEDMVSWARNSLVKHGEQFFAMWRINRNNQLAIRRVLRSHVTSAVKRAASHFNLDPRNFSTRSLRIGGATNLTSAGFEDEVVRKLGYWRSDASRIYEQCTPHDTGPLLIASNKGGLGVFDVSQMQGSLLASNPYIFRFPASSSASETDNLI